MIHTAIVEAPPSAPRNTTRTAALLFAVYLGLLVWIVLWKLHVPFIGRDDMREIKLVPFAPDDGYGASAPFEVIANLLIFVPFGLHLGLLAPRWRWSTVAAWVAAASLALEIAQYATAVGSSDVTDVLVNTTGGVAGFALLGLIRRRLGSRTAAVMAWVLVAGTALALVVVAMHIASFPRLGAPP